MKPRFPWRSVAILCGIVACVGLWAGWNFATMTETDVINAAAVDYVETGPETATTDHCVAEPGTPPVWVTIICAQPGEAASAIYQADRLGRLTRIEPANADDAVQL